MKPAKGDLAAASTAAVFYQYNVMSAVFG